MKNFKNFFRNFVKKNVQKEPQSTLIQNIPEQGLVLDAGSGEGRYANMLTKEGRTIICLDLIPPKKRNPDSEQILGSIEHLPFKSDMFDFVYSISVLQFLNNDAQGLYEFQRILKPGRKLVFTVPTKYSIFHIIRELEIFFNVYEYQFNVPSHHYFSKTRIKQLLGNNFSEGRIQGITFNFFPRFKVFTGNLFKKYHLIRSTSNNLEEDLNNEYKIENYPRESPDNRFFLIFNSFIQFFTFFAWHYIVISKKK